jgi:hypothetical protein
MSLNFFRKLTEFFSFPWGRDIEARKRINREKAELRRQKEVENTTIDYELEMLKIKLSEQLLRVKERESRTTQDYKEFLDMIDEMKVQIVEAYPDMPKVMALVIHQHAKRLIDEMWNNPDEQMQHQCRARLSKFIQIVYDDTAEVLLAGDRSKLPSKTLDQIEKM